MTREQLENALFNGQTHVFAVLDGARVDGLRQRLFEMQPPSVCLFRGELEPDVADNAPYLVGLIKGSPFADWLLDGSPGRHWGIFAQTQQSMTEMRRHFRALVTVHDENGTPMIFRFYDPRVLQRFLPTCNGGELRTLFGKVDAFFAEDDAGTLHCYRLSDGTLEESKAVEGGT